MNIKKLFRLGSTDAKKTENKSAEQVVTTKQQPIKINTEEFEKTKKMLAESIKKSVVLSHAHLQLICSSYNLVLRHYSEFQGKMPPEKIFAMPALQNKYKMYLCVNKYAKNWETFTPSNAKHGRYYSKKEMNNYLDYWKKLDSEVCFIFEERPAIFIIAPKELFDIEKAGDMMDQILDPIIVERIGDDEYRVHSFWNTPEALSVHLSDTSLN